MEMTQSALVELCKQRKLYRTPELNDALYCNHKGFVRIANLEPYINLKSLYLEGNVLRSLEGLPPLADLKCMFVQNNCLSSLSGIENAPGLVSLNISGNSVASLDALAACPQLATLVAERNQLETLDSISAIAGCTALQTLDLQNNNISDPGIVGLVASLPELRCLYLKGNPVVGQVPSYRKTVITAAPGLTYLDDRPVFDEERRCAQAWSRGGMEEERVERQRCRDEEEAARRRNFEWMQELRRSGLRKRREMLGLPPGDTDPMLDEFSDSEPEFEEPMELVEARARLARLVAESGGEALQDPAVAAEVSEAGHTLPMMRPSDQDAPSSGSQRDDARDYFASVRECQAVLDAGGASLMVPDHQQVAEPLCAVTTHSAAEEVGSDESLPLLTGTAGGLVEEEVAAASSEPCSAYEVNGPVVGSEQSAQPLFAAPEVQVVSVVGDFALPAADAIEEGEVVVNSSPGASLAVATDVETSASSPLVVNLPPLPLPNPPVAPNMHSSSPASELNNAAVADGGVGVSLAEGVEATALAPQASVVDAEDVKLESCNGGVQPAAEIVDLFALD